jgi:beta-glucanase (GH16 family)
VQSFPFVAINDDRLEELERLLLALNNPVGAELGFLHRTTIAIRDNEEPDPNLIANFDIAPPFVTSGTITLTTPIQNAGDPLALPEQTTAAGVLQVDYQGTALFGQSFAAAQDWSNHQGVSFWFYGQNSSQTYTLQLLDNRTTTTADLPPAEWQLLWSDEFNHPAGTPPNPAIWRPEIGDGTLNGIPGWGNSELESYTNSIDNAATDGSGNLAITARAVGDQAPNLVCWYGPCEYTSARLITWDRLEVQYGRIEARLRLPQGQGIWPAFWLLGTNLDEVSWPQSGEIDIMENIGREPATVHGTVHGPGYSGGSGIGQGYDLPTGNFADDFHLFAIEWTPADIRWFVDNENHFTLTPDEIPAGTEWVYDHPFFIILNLAVGGNWPGYPDKTTTFPQTMLVDYVRVYGAPPTSEQFETTFVDDFTGWQLLERPFADFTRSPTQPAAAPDDGLTLTDIWGYHFVLPPDSSGPIYFDQLRFE